MKKPHLVRLRAALIICTVTLSACSDEGKGTAKFTTWGEGFIEEGIPANPDEGGFSDGWTVKYDKFLVAFHEITVGDETGTPVARMTGSKLVDNVKAGSKDLISFPDLPARAYRQVGYQIKPALADSELVAGAAEADRAMMVAAGFSIYVSGTATKGDVAKTFHWGFKTATQYRSCLQPAESGQPIEGIVVTNGGEDTSELTTHGDHFFYDRLKASEDPAIVTSLRFEEKAAADANQDSEITLEELNAAPIDIQKYDPSGFEAPTLGAFMNNLARTVGHFRGEGECNVSAVK
jgi:hypothetical protein